MYYPDVKVVISGILPHKSIFGRSQKILKVNSLLKSNCRILKNIYYLEHDHDWNNADGSLKEDLYYHDQLHLIEAGNTKLSNEMNRAIKLARNDTDFIDKSSNSKLLPHPVSHHICHVHSPVSRPVSLSCSVLPHSFPLRKSNNVTKPKWEKCW